MTMNGYFVTSCNYTLEAEDRYDTIYYTKNNRKQEEKSDNGG